MTVHTEEERLTEGNFLHYAYDLPQGIHGGRR